MVKKMVKVKLDSKAVYLCRFKARKGKVVVDVRGKVTEEQLHRILDEPRDPYTTPPPSPVKCPGAPRKPSEN